MKPSTSSSLTSLCLALCVILTGSVLAIPYGSVAAQSDTDIQQATNQAIYLSKLESAGNSSALYNLVHPDVSAIIPKEVVAGWYENDFFPLAPQPISEITGIRFIDWTWGVTGNTYANTAEIDFVQPFGTGGNVQYVSETVRLVKANDGKWRWFVGRSEEFVQTQRDRFQTEPVSQSDRSSRQRGSRTAGTSNSSANNASKCTLVELAPGYPGYRGLVTGLSANYGGLGDWDCLESLQRDNPGFNQANEDRLNQEAATALGINGDSSVWLWENWMAIETYRGLPTHCYTCLMLGESSLPINTSITQDWNDPRIRVGLFGSNSAVDSYLQTPQQRGNFADNYQLRAHAFLLKGPFTNAIEVLAVYDGLAQSMDDHWLLFQDYDYLFRVGGYAWVTEFTYPEDQMLVMFYGIVAHNWHLPSPVRNAQLARLDSLVMDWRSELLAGSRESLAAFLKARW